MSQEIVNYDEILAQLAKKATKTEKPSTSSIGVRAGVLSYNGQPVPGNKLDCIIIASTHANLYYEDAFKERVVRLAPTWRALGLTGGRRSFFAEIERLTKSR